MRTVEVTLYSFEELSKESQQKALDKHIAINVKHEWWDTIFDDAKNIGLIIEQFDFYNKYIDAHIQESHYETAHKIKDDHGPECETHKLAIQFILDWDALIEKYSNGINKNEVLQGNEEIFDPLADELEKNFFKALCREYLNSIEKEYEHLISDEQVKESLIANEYEFTENGNLWR